MSGGLEIIVLGAIAGFILWRLRSVLGRRTGHEQQSPTDLFGRRDNATGRADPSNDNVVRLPNRDNEPPHARDREDEEDEALAGPLGDHIRRAREVDPGFHPNDFIGGAKLAYEMIVTAFAGGDRKALKPLLAEDVYQSFATAIDEREARGESVETNFVGIKSADLTGLNTRGQTVEATVRFVSEMISSTRDKEGRVIEGSPAEIREVADIWTFARDASSSDPNWSLVATSAED